MTLTLTQTKYTIHTVGTISLFVEEHRLEGPRGELRLTASHFRVMLRLMRHPGHIISHSDLISELYPDPDLEGENADVSLRLVIMTLRRALALLGAEKAAMIINEHNVGYLMREDNRRLKTEKAA